MNFGNFTGSSRRPRNVNLSGRSSSAASRWGNPSGANQSISNAQAERQQRHLERQRLASAKRVQRAWRGHRARRTLKGERRAEFDELYRGAGLEDGTHARFEAGLLLLLQFFDKEAPDDEGRLAALADDALSLDEKMWDTELHRLARFASILISVAKTLPEDRLLEEGQRLIALVERIVTKEPRAIAKCLPQYFDLCATLSQTSPPPMVDDLVSPVLRPSPGSAGYDARPAYRQFAASFLSSPDLNQFEDRIDAFAAIVDMPTLGSVVAELCETGEFGASPTWTSGMRANLLAHFIHLSGAGDRLGSAGYNLSTGATVIDATHRMILALFDDVKSRMDPMSPAEAAEDGGGEPGPASEPLSSYVRHQLLRLTSKDSLSQICRDFSSVSLESLIRNTSAVSGYFLALLKAFPSSEDDIRMRLLLEDVTSHGITVSVIHFLLGVAKMTRIYSSLLHDPSSPTKLVRQYLSSSEGLLSTSTSEQEWRIMLLFLELFIFVLRLSDDDDFFAMISPPLEPTAPPSRLRASSFSLQDVSAMSSVLKNLCFSLYHDAAEIGKHSPSDVPSSHAWRQNFMDLRQLASTALRLVYDRDSRRPFLPQGHWLMTSKFAMDAFINDVVAEEQRQHELKEEEAEAAALMEEDEDEAEPLTPRRVGKMVSGMHLARIEPKLEILRNMPFVIPFRTRVLIFKKFVLGDKIRRRHGDGSADPWRLMADQGRRSKQHAVIQRGRVFADAMKQFWDLRQGLKEPIEITFIDRFGHQEAGIDGGGVTKEFLTSITKEVFEQKEGVTLFTENSQNLLFPNPNAVDQRREVMGGVAEGSAAWLQARGQLADEYEFLGRVVGKCMYEGVLLDFHFAGFFLLKWAAAHGEPGDGSAYKGNPNDLRDLDEDVYNGLMQLKSYRGDCSAFGLDFTVDDRVSLDGKPVKTVTRNLVPNGDSVAVTNDNRLLYISYVARHRLVKQPLAQTKAFLEGLHAIISPSWLSMFNQSELQRLVGGDSSSIDVEDLRNFTLYSGLYAREHVEGAAAAKDHPTIAWFWEVMEEFSPEERCDVVKYVTSTPRPPLLGFGHLQPQFTIRDGGTDEMRLPSASTCVNLLKLPVYRSKATLKAKLKMAISSGAGFDMS